MKKLDIVYEDKYIIVINKRPNLLTIATSKHEENTLYREVYAYIKKQSPKNKIFIVHRLDKDTSGLILFAKNGQLKEYFQTNWSTFARKYYAITENIPSPLQDRLVNYLVETKTYQTYCTNDAKRGKQAITNYQVIKKKKPYALLDISIETGRKNQIRAQLSNIGCPIVGDKKYAAQTNPLHRLCLHAYYLAIYHPIKKTLMVFETPIPQEFQKLI